MLVGLLSLLGILLEKSNLLMRSALRDAIEGVLNGQK